MEKIEYYENHRVEKKYSKGFFFFLEKILLNIIISVMGTIAISLCNSILLLRVD